jgi:hypothetical protein
VQVDTLRIGRHRDEGYATPGPYFFDPLFEEAATTATGQLA